MRVKRDRGIDFFLVHVRIVHVEVPRATSFGAGYEKV